MIKMKKIKYVFLILVFLQFSCNTNKEEKSCCKKDGKTEEKTSGAVNSDESIYNLESDWKMQNNEVVKLSRLAGKSVIAAMVFTHCESACPRIVADIKRIEKELSPEEKANTTFLLISMDPERDTPERFKEFAKEHQLNKDWVMISSSKDATMEIANILNVRVKKLSDGGFDHSNTIYLLDKNGNIIYQQNGLAQEPTEIIKQLKELN